MALLYDTFKVEMPPWSAYNSYRCYLDNCDLCYDSVKGVYVCVKHKTNHVCGWATDNYNEQEGAYQGPKCPVVENEEGWLVCEMTGQVLDSQAKYLPNPTPQDYKCDEEEPMMILTDHEITELLQNKPNEKSFYTVDNKLFVDLLNKKGSLDLQQRYMVYACMANLWRNDPYFTRFNHKRRYKVTKALMAACWDYENRNQDRPTGLITHTYRKLNDLTRHLKFIIRSVTGQRQSIFNKRKKKTCTHTDNDDVLPHILVNN